MPSVAAHPAGGNLDYFCRHIAVLSAEILPSHACNPTICPPIVVHRNNLERMELPYGAPQSLRTNPQYAKRHRYRPHATRYSRRICQARLPSTIQRCQANDSVEHSIASRDMSNHRRHMDDVSKEQYID